MASARVSWRRFSFFTKDMLCEGDGLSTLLALAPGTVVTAAACYQGGSSADAPAGEYLVIGDSNGCIYVVASPAMRLLNEPGLQAFRGPVARLVVADAAAAGAVLVAAGDDGGGVGALGSEVPSFSIKLWSLEALIGPGRMTTPMRTLPLSSNLKPPPPPELHQLTALAVMRDGTQIAVGLRSGTLVLFHGDGLPTREGAKVSAPTVLQVSDSITGMPQAMPISTLHFCERGDRQVKLFVGTAPPLGGGGGPSGGAPAAAGGGAGGGEGRLLVFDTTNGAARAPPVLLDDRGCAHNCAALDAVDRQLVVARTDGIYFYSSEDRGGAAGFEGEKQCVACLAGYILVASYNNKSQRTEINVYDLRNKFVAYFLRLPAGQLIQHVISVAGGHAAYVITSAHSVFFLQEKDTKCKLDVLYRMNLYPSAIQLAYAAGYAVEAVMEIYRMFGDHLYKKCDWDGAMTQYCQTIGYVEPSYVIRRFLDAQRITNLTMYLERLHETHDGEYVTSDHTTLLLNCYAKLKDVDKLNRFINPETQSEAAGGTGATTIEAAKPGVGRAGVTASAHVNFDVETAIRVLKSAGYSEHALELARKHGAHDWYLRIQLERSSPDFADALAYIASLPFEDAEADLKKYGKALVSHLPEATTELLMKLCTGCYTPTSGGFETQPGKKSSPENYVHLFADRTSCLRLFLDYILSEEGSVSSPIANTLLELLLREWDALVSERRLATSTSTRSIDPLAVTSANMMSDPLAISSAPETLAALPLGGGSRHAGGAARGDSEVDRDDATSPQKEIEARTALKAKEEEVMALLRNERAPYDKYHALVLVEVHSFKAGQLYLYERLARSDSSNNAELGGVVTALLLEHYSERTDVPAMLRMCRREVRPRW
jgi:hypothetical protein